MSKQITIGMVAPVDAGKTTLSEAMLYQAGTIHRLGRVDHQDAFLDPEALEKQRGITISAHQAQLSVGQTKITLLDTPGHVDFASTTEQVLAVLDYAILVVSATDGVTGAVQYLWQMLQRTGVPTIVFVNKMDAPGVDAKKIITSLQQLSSGCLSFEGASQQMTSAVADNVAAVDETVLADYLTTGKLTDAATYRLIKNREVFPVLFGAALHQQGVSELLAVLNQWTLAPEWGKDFAARCFKIFHGTRGERLTWLRVTGGILNVKDELLPGQKADQLRIYNGGKFTTVQQATAGQVCAVSGPTTTFAGQGLGRETDFGGTVHSVLEYAVQTAVDIRAVREALRMIADEDPAINLSWQPESQELTVDLTGTVQKEIIEQQMAAKGLPIKLTTGKIIYQETVTQSVEGVGHFEPLRHYAEVHLLIEPAPRGSGLQFANEARVEDLKPNWQSQVMAALAAKEHRGVLVGAPLTDVKITLLGGRGSIVHTVGGDLREATWRAVRQGLISIRSTGCQLLEPWYRFRLVVDNSVVGRALNDIARMGGKTGNHVPAGAALTILSGKAPVATMVDYAADVRNYTHGQGQLSLVVDGFEPCHNQQAVVDQSGYDPCADLDNSPDSIFCAHGAKYTVKWDDIKRAMHRDYYWQKS
ncbi:elongation factor G [[Lactobacillus] timonensis]|uniref:elongation factor G n=1 Tax=[Lactobacillus] timonensis TaxID=1970790 RepID=UPI000C855CCE|nr:TetM/TetW/TetO/TetS family tetracycline resistance ribosomal protection protein [[Lactobacillus] timonensis]